MSRRNWLIGISSIVFLLLYTSYVHSSEVDHWQRGIDYYDKGNYKRAQREFEVALLQNPSSPSLLTYLGLANYKQDEIDKAIAIFNRALAIDPDYIWALNARGYMHQLKGDFHNASTDYHRALQIFPEFLGARINLADLFRRQGRFKKALENYEIALKIKPDEIYILNWMGIIYSILGDYPRAEETFKEIIEINQVSIEAILAERLKGHILSSEYMNSREEDQADRSRKEGNIDRAIEEYKRRIAQNEKDADAYFWLGLIYAVQEINDEAILHLNRVIELQPRGQDVPFIKDLIIFIRIAEKFG